MSDATWSAAGLRIVKLLVGHPPRTISDLSRAAGVTRTAVVEQLDELMATGLVVRDTQRLSGRGRPHHLYKATDAALLLLCRGNRSLAAKAMWRAIRDIGGEELVKKVVKRVGHALAAHYAKKITARKPHERLRQLAALMAAEGCLVEMGTNGRRRSLYKRSCPFISMADDHRSVCQMDLEMLSAVVGHPIRQTGHRRDGHPCCTFELAE